MTNCGWCGLPCSCNKFPFTRNELIPTDCENRIADEIPYLIPHRKVQMGLKELFKAYLKKIKAAEISISTPFEWRSRLKPRGKETDK